MTYGYFKKFSKQFSDDFVQSIIKEDIKYQKFKLLSKGKRWFPDKVRTSDSCDNDYVMGLFSVMVTGKCYKIPRIVKRAL